jgi:hypothetical protein
VEVRMEHTQGLGKLAEIYVGEQSLLVCDGLSSPDKRCSPGLLENVRFTYVTEEGFAWPAAIVGNTARRQRLDHIRDWSYTGFGQVVSVMPVVIDFGLLKMQDANWTGDEKLIGRYVRVAIDRLEVSPAFTPDWPDAVKALDR